MGWRRHRFSLLIIYVDTIDSRNEFKTWQVLGRGGVGVSPSVHEAVRIPPMVRRSATTGPVIGSHRDDLRYGLYHDNEDDNNDVRASTNVSERFLYRSRRGELGDSGSAETTASASERFSYRLGRGELGDSGSTDVCRRGSRLLSVGQSSERRGQTAEGFSCGSRRGESGVSGEDRRQAGVGCMREERCREGGVRGREEEAGAGVDGGAAELVTVGDEWKEACTSDGRM